MCMAAIYMTHCLTVTLFSSMYSIPVETAVYLSVIGESFWKEWPNRAVCKIWRAHITLPSLERESLTYEPADQYFFLGHSHFSLEKVVRDSSSSCSSLSVLHLHRGRTSTPLTIDNTTHARQSVMA